jgi:hypothetical protein
MSYLCPECQRELYNRRLAHCGFCGAPIPEELRFTPEQIAKLDREMADLDERRKQRQLEAEKDEKERREREIDSSGYLS